MGSDAPPPSAAPSVYPAPQPAWGAPPAHGGTDQPPPGYPPAAPGGTSQPPPGYPAPYQQGGAAAPQAPPPVGQPPPGAGYPGEYPAQGPPHQQGLPPGAVGLAKIGGVLVPVATDGRPMLEYLTPAQATIVQAEAGSLFHKVAAAGCCTMVLCFIFCPWFAIYFCLLNICCAAVMSKKLQTSAHSNMVPADQVAAFAAQQAAATGQPPAYGAHVPPTQQAMPSGYPAAGGYAADDKV